MKPMERREWLGVLLAVVLLVCVVGIAKADEPKNYLETYEFNANGECIHTITSDCDNCKYIGKAPKWRCCCSGKELEELGKHIMKLEDRVKELEDTTNSSPWFPQPEDYKKLEKILEEHNKRMKFIIPTSPSDGNPYSKSE